MHDRSSIVKKNISNSYLQKRYPSGNFTGDYMTICIASMWGNDSLILISDMMLSADIFSADMMALKVRRIAKGWLAAFAAMDISSVLPIIERVKKRLSNDDDKTLDSVSNAFAESYRDELLQKSERLVLAPLGLGVCPSNS